MIIPSPRKLGRTLPRGYTVKPGYGERKRARVAAAIPLFAGLPGMVATADEYEASLSESITRMWQRLRLHAAQNWRKTRAWLRQASDEQRALWLSAWGAPPHNPEMAADICWQIDHDPGPLLEHRAAMARIRRDWVARLTAVLRAIVRQRLLLEAS